jgi:hypothetical protein
MRGYQEFTTGTVWYLIDLAERGWVENIHAARSRVTCELPAR